MDSPIRKPEISPCSKLRRRQGSANSNSPEFEFWMVRNPSFPPSNLLTPDELIVDGVLLPLQLLRLQPPDRQHPNPESVPGTELLPFISVTESTQSVTASKRWTDISKKGEKNNSKQGQNGAYLWPFSRSRSATNNETRPKMVPETIAGKRKASSAPCSRSNSAGESKLRKWPNSPARAGVHLIRRSPTWHGRRVGSRSETRRDKAVGGGGAKARVLHLNMPMCIGYKEQVSCINKVNCDVKGSGSNGGRNSSSGCVNGSGGGGGGGGGGGNMFNLRGFFRRKVY